MERPFERADTVETFKKLKILIKWYFGAASILCASAVGLHGQGCTFLQPEKLSWDSSSCFLLNALSPLENNIQLPVLILSPSIDYMFYFISGSWSGCGGWQQPPLAVGCPLPSMLRSRCQHSHPSAAGLRLFVYFFVFAQTFVVFVRGSNHCDSMKAFLLQNFPQSMLIVFSFLYIPALLFRSLKIFKKIAWHSLATTLSRVQK